MCPIHSAWYGVSLGGFGFPGGRGGGGRQAALINEVRGNPGQFSEACRNLHY